MRGEKQMKRVLYLIFIFSVLLMSWDFQKEDAALAQMIELEGETIPDQAIRLRIIANSDSAEDQLLKQKVRDEIIDEVNLWVNSLDDIESAREIITAHLPELQKIVDQTIKESGFTYNSTVELGVVPFPTKMYGQTVYPAGDYEALRVTIGAAEGQNWWCVLFPPLCFVDMSTATAVAKEPSASTKANSTNSDVDQSDDRTNTSMTDEKIKNDIENENEVQVKFFLFEMAVKFVSYVKTIV